jgi:hypothetical protein
MQIWSTNSGWWQIFKFENNQFINFSNNKVLDVRSQKDEEGNAVDIWNNNGGDGQKWDVLYLDKSKGPQTKGLNKDFGFHVNRPFHIISKLPFGRMLECIGANNVTQRRWRKNTKAQ